MQDRFNKLVDTLRPISGLSEESGISHASIEKKLSGNRPVRRVDILALERIAQTRDARLESLIVEAILRIAKRAYTDGQDSEPGSASRYIRATEEKAKRAAASAVRKSVYK